MRRASASRSTLDALGPSPAGFARVQAPPHALRAFGFLLVVMSVVHMARRVLDDVSQLHSQGWTS